MIRLYNPDKDDLFQSALGLLLHPEHKARVKDICRRHARYRGLMAISSGLMALLLAVMAGAATHAAALAFNLAACAFWTVYGLRFWEERDAWKRLADRP